eukprot:gene62210-biopygen45288
MRLNHRVWKRSQQFAFHRRVLCQRRGLNTVLRGTAETLGTVTVFDGTNALGTAVADAAGQWTLRPAVALANGLRTFTASVRDVAGNVSPLSAAVSLAVDSYPPDSPVIDTAGTFNLATPPITGRAEPLGSVRLFAGAALLGTAPVLADGRWTFTPATPLAEGQHALAAVAIDAAGNVGPFSATRVITIDTVAPTAPVVTPLVTAATTPLV